MEDIYPEPMFPDYTETIKAALREAYPKKVERFSMPRFIGGRHGECEMFKPIAESDLAEPMLPCRVPVFKNGIEVVGPFVETELKVSELDVREAKRKIDSEMGIP